RAVLVAHVDVHCACLGDHARSFPSSAGARPFCRTRVTSARPIGGKHLALRVPATLTKVVLPGSHLRPPPVTVEPWPTRHRPMRSASKGSERPSPPPTTSRSRFAPCGESTCRWDEGSSSP